jgi:hypothetical protein
VSVPVSKALRIISLMLVEVLLSWIQRSRVFLGQLRQLTVEGRLLISLECQ